MRQTCSDRTKYYEHALSIGSVDKVPACVKERIKELEAALLVHRAHAVLLPLVTDAHGTELYRGDMDACERRKRTMPSELGLGLGRGSQKVTHGESVLA